jgi:hypothetical protein
MKKGLTILLCICIPLSIWAANNEISCAEAAKIAATLSHNSPTTETYTVVGYVTETDGKLSRNQQIFWMADTRDGGQVFQSYWCNVPEVMLVGDYVSITGKIMRYNQTPEIKNGEVTLLSREPISTTNEEVTISNPDTWTYSELQKYIGKTITFTTPFYVCNNYSSSLTISPRRIYQATNQALPLSAEYNSILSLNAQGTVSLSGVSGYHRLGERLHNLKVKVNSATNLSLVSCDWRDNTRAELEQGYDSIAVNMLGEASLIVCCMNLEYYLTSSFGTGYGPTS